LEEVSGLGGVMDSKWLTRLLKVVSLAVVVEAVVVLMAARTRLLRILNLGIWWWIKSVFGIVVAFVVAVCKKQFHKKYFL
jgi:uncharacterized membrane protein